MANVEEPSDGRDLRPGRYRVDVSVVIAVRNGIPFIENCLAALLNQEFEGTWEICVYNDGSTDSTKECVESFITIFALDGVELRISNGSECRGVGYAKNRAVEMSTGRFICFCDADDIPVCTRIQEQYIRATSFPENSLVFVGSNFRRSPYESTPRYTKWANELSCDKLTLQVFTSHGPTLVAPTWFISRGLFTQLNGFKEDVTEGYPEDLEFFYRALDVGNVCFTKIDRPLVIYRYHPGSASFRITENVIRKLRLSRFCSTILPKWEAVTIWNAGKQGKCFFRSLAEAEKKRVVAFCDVDRKKIRRRWYEEYDARTRLVKWKVPIIHINAAHPPVVICVKLDMTGGQLERFVSEFGWEEGRDFVYFG